MELSGIRLTGKPTTRLPTQAIFLQLFPVRLRVVDGDLAPGRNPPRDHEYALEPTPIKFLKLTVGSARVVYEAGEVAHVALENLIWSFRCTANHHIQTVDSVRDETDKFGDSGTSFKFLVGISIFLRLDRKKQIATYTSCNDPVVLATTSGVQLDWRRIANTAKKCWETRAMIQDHIVALFFLAYWTDLGIYLRDTAGVLGAKHVLVNYAVVYKSIFEAVR